MKKREREAVLEENYLNMITAVRLLTQVIRMHQKRYMELWRENQKLKKAKK